MQLFQKLNHRRRILWVLIFLSLAIAVYAWLNSSDREQVFFNAERVLDHHVITDTQHPDQHRIYLRIRFTQGLNPETVLKGLNIELAPGLSWVNQEPSEFAYFEDNKIIEITTPPIQAPAAGGVVTLNLLPTIHASTEPPAQLQRFSFLAVIPAQSAPNPQ